MPGAFLRNCSGGTGCRLCRPATVRATVVGRCRAARLFRTSNEVRSAYEAPTRFARRRKSRHRGSDAHHINTDRRLAGRIGRSVPIKPDADEKQNGSYVRGFWCWKDAATGLVSTLMIGLRSDEMARGTCS